MRVGGGGIGPRQEFINIIAGAYMTAIVLSIVGFVLGAILVARQREGHGIRACRNNIQIGSAPRDVKGA